MRPVGLIIGHGYAKAVSGGRMARFPAVAALARKTGYESAIGHGPAVIQVNDLGAWIVGEDALTFAPQRLVSILDRTRYTNPHSSPSPARPSFRSCQIPAASPS